MKFNLKHISIFFVFCIAAINNAFFCFGRERTVIPYSVNGEISFDNSDVFESCCFDGCFYNDSSLDISSFTIVFFVLDSEGNSPVKGRNNIVLKIQEEIKAFSEYEFSISLKRYLVIPEDGEQVAQYEIEYLYASCIEYTDGSMWSDPFGIKYF